MIPYSYTDFTCGRGGAYMEQSDPSGGQTHMKLGVMKDVWIKASLPSSNLGSVGPSLPPEAPGFVGI